MPSGSAYQPLADYLASRKGDSWAASFDEVEAKLGRPLPQSAYRHPAWWANQSGPGHSQTRGWRSVGWRTTKLDLERRRVCFERDRASRPVSEFDAAPHRDRRMSEGQARLVQQAMAVSGIGDRDEVIEAALRAFIQQEAIAGLIEAGGSMPDFVLPPRERPHS